MLRAAKTSACVAAQHQQHTAQMQIARFAQTLACVPAQCQQDAVRMWIVRSAQPNAQQIAQKNLATF